jgi:hypothetical protein
MSFRFLPVWQARVSESIKDEQVPRFPNRIILFFLGR